ncbi:MAG: AgmX/PglI C-terminal domain-containing protein [Polyangiaceae bacterium]|nr:AgmX/PglI C-terminal domain-containing protein [Polyangiaceae bacterium]
MHGCSVAHGVAGAVLLGVLGFWGCSSQPPAKTGGDDPVGGAAAGGEDIAPEPGEGAAGGAEGEGSGDSASGEPKDRDTESIQKVIVDNRKPFRDCYDKLRKEIPTLAGTLTLTFTLDGEGTVKSAEMNPERSDLKAPDVVKCAVAELKKLKFPPSVRGMDTTVNYPFNFKP